MSELDHNHFLYNQQKAEERVWEIGNTVRVFEQDWSEIQAVWSDAASDYIRDRYLTSIQSNDEKVVLSVNHQIQKTQIVSGNFSEIKENLQSAFQHSQESEHFSLVAVKELDGASHENEHARAALNRSSQSQRACESAICAADSHVAPI